MPILFDKGALYTLADGMTRGTRAFETMSKANAWSLRASRGEAKLVRISKRAWLHLRGKSLMERDSEGAIRS